MKKGRPAADTADAAGVLSEAWATVEDSDELDNFQPHVIHKPHAPVPVAMCCRKPHGCGSISHTSFCREQQS